MSKKRFTTEEIIDKLREVKTRTNRGGALVDIIRQLGISEQSYLRWHKEYGELSADQARRLKELQRENAWLRRALSDALIDNQILRERSGGDF